MASLLCKRRPLGWLSLGLVMSMLFGLFGCGSRLSPEEAAARHLEKKYGRVFHVETLSRKEGGPFLSEDYSGTAWEEGKPEERFTVWVSTDSKTVKDAYYTVALLPAVNDWVSTTARAVWSDAQTLVCMDALSYNSRPDYGTEDYLRFYENETVNNTVILVLPDSEELSDRFNRFHSTLDGVMTGYITVYIGEHSHPRDLLDREADAEIMIGSPDHVIQEKLEGV